MLAPLARSDLHSLVQPPVKAFGNQASTTACWPRWSESLWVLPSEPRSENSGAASPSSSGAGRRAAQARASATAVTRPAFLIADSPSAPSVDRHVRHVAGARVVALRSDELVVLELLEHVRRPPRDPRDREHRREEVGGDAKHVVGGGGVEVHVAVQALLGAHDLLHLLGEGVPLAVSLFLSQPLRHAAQ